MAARLDLSRAVRGFHSGLLVFSKQDNHIVVINHRIAWYALNKEVLYSGEVNCRMRYTTIIIVNWLFLTLANPAILLASGNQ